MPAQAKHEPEPKVVTPARAIDVPEPNGETPAQANTLSEPSVTTPAQAKHPPKSIPGSPAQARRPPTPMPDSPAQAKAGSMPISPPPAQADPILNIIRTLARMLDDLETVRIMNTNRIGALEREHGEALPHLHATVETLKAAEHQAQLELIRAWRKHPLAPWAKSVRGAGEKTIARLISLIGCPTDKSEYDRPPLYAPNPAKLWAYCGHGNPDRKRAKGMTQAELFKLGNPEAKKRVYLVAEAMVKDRQSAYRATYDAAREKYATRTHQGNCVRCGPAGKPALPGSPWSLGHQHAAAMRLVGKVFLKELWIAART